MTKRRGFTLIEVMVALTVLAVALTAGYRALGQSTNNVDLLKRRAFAQWVAQNQLAAMQLDRSGTLPVDGEARQTDIDFVWRATVNATPNAAFRRVEIVVADKAQPDYQLARLTAYVSAPQ
ncbi:MAG: type II secretion system minor pseudopilin GspI [Betaproteobacteria bacterium]